MGAGPRLEGPALGGANNRVGETMLLSGDYSKRTVVLNQKMTPPPSAPPAHKEELWLVAC